MFKTILSSILLLVFLYNPLHAEVTGKVVNYKSGGTSLIGYIAYDNSMIWLAVVCMPKQFLKLKN